MVKDRLSDTAVAGGAGQPLRSLLVVPPGRDTSDGMGGHGADALVLQGPAPDAAEPGAAAQRVKAFLERASAAGCRAFVTVDGDDPAGMALALEAAMPGAPHGIVLANSEGATSVQRLGARLAVLEAEHGFLDGQTLIVAIGASSPASLFGLGSYRNASARLSGLSWSPEKLAAEIEIEVAPGDRHRAEPLRLARVLTVIAAKAAGVEAIDAASESLGHVFEAECLAARRDGFGAKFAIEPRQVAVINAIFGVP